MTREFGSHLFVIQNLLRNLAFGFRIQVLNPRPVGGEIRIHRALRRKTENLTSDSPCLFFLDTKGKINLK
jgi:hypothetical protein